MLSQDCIHCKLCTKNCLFLDKYQIDLAGLEAHPELAYSCFLCGKCKAVCPKDIDGAKIAIEARTAQVQAGKGAAVDKSYKGLLWEKNPYKFANYRKGKKKSVLFPGCNFTAFYPKTTKRLEKIMEEKGIGVVYECCRKPVYELGLEKDAMDAIRVMETKLKNQGVEELIMVCPNCYHFLKDKIDLQVVTIYEKLRELEVPTKDIIGIAPVYYPCPDRESKEMFEQIKPFLQDGYLERFQKIQCCGLGGCAAAKEGELADQMTVQAQKCNDKMYTYCASCVSNFKRKGYSKAYHFLPAILGVEEDLPTGIKPIVNRAKKVL